MRITITLANVMYNTVESVLNALLVMCEKIGLGSTMLLVYTRAINYEHTTTVVG